MPRRLRKRERENVFPMVDERKNPLQTRKAVAPTLPGMKPEHQAPTRCGRELELPGSELPLFTWESDRQEQEAKGSKYTDAS